MDNLMRQVDPSLLEAMALVERKFTRLTLVAAMGFMVAWLPFCLLCMWELATPPDEIPTSMAFFLSFSILDRKEEQDILTFGSRIELLLSSIFRNESFLNGVCIL